MDSVLLDNAFAMRSDLGDPMAKHIRLCETPQVLLDTDDELAQMQQRIVDRRQEIGNRLASFYALELPGVAA